MSITVNTSLRNQQVDTWGTDLNSGVIEIYTGAQPAADVAPTGTLLVSCALTADAYAAATEGAAVQNGTVQGTAVADGIAGYARQRNAGSTRWQYGSVTAIGGGGDVQLSTTTIAIDDVITINTSIISMPESC